MQKPKFKVAFLEEAESFLDSLDEKIRDKIIYNITKASYSIDKELFKKLTQDLWEFRTFYHKAHYRLFAFWDRSEKTETLVISTHGIIKKTDKLTKDELNKAEKLRIKYFELKANKK